MVADGAAKTWVHLTVNGSWKGHPRGEFSFDPAIHEQIVANFSRQDNPIPLTYEHPGKEDGKPIPAAGWLHELEIRPNGLWGFVEFTDTAAEMVRNGEQRYCSVVVDFDAIDRVTGESVGPELFEVGLTNTPFLDAQEPIRLSRHATSPRHRLAKGTQMDPEKILEECAAALGLEGDATPEQMTAAMKAMADLVDSRKKPEPKEETPAKETEAAQVAATSEMPAKPIMAADESVSGAARDDISRMLEDALGMDTAALMALLMQKKDQLAQLLGVDKEQAPTGGETRPRNEQDEAAKLLSSTKDVAHATIAALEAQIKDRDTKIGAMGAELAKLGQAANEDRIEKAIAAGRVLPGDREKMIRLAAKAPELLDEFIGSRQAVPTGTLIATTRASAPTLTDLDQTSEEYQAYDRALKRFPAEKRERIIRARMAERLAQSKPNGRSTGGVGAT